MESTILVQGLAACFGTIAFAIIFGVPKRFYLACGVIGAVSWLVYYILTGRGMANEGATFIASFLVVVLARLWAVVYTCPATIFIIPGILPLVPGGGIYWTAYYLVADDGAHAWNSGNAAVRIAFTIVLGIVAALELPEKLFHLVKLPELSRSKKSVHAPRS